MLEPIGMFSATATVYTLEVNCGGLSLKSIGETITSMLLTNSGVDSV